MLGRYFGVGKGRSKGKPEGYNIICGGKGSERGLRRRRDNYENENDAPQGWQRSSSARG